MQSNWPFEPISDHADVYSGFAFKSAELSNSDGIPVVKIKNVNHGLVDLSETQFFPSHLVTIKHDKFFLSDGDVLIAMTGQGSVGRVGRLRLDGEKEVLLNQRVGKFSPKDSLDLQYFFYIASTEYYEQIFFNAGLGSGQPNLSPDDIKNIEIPVPPIGVQKAIAHILGALDDKIELNRQMNATLESMTQALFKSWFVDFDPVIDNALAAGNPIPESLHARAETRKALGEQRKPLPEEIQVQFPDRFVFNEDMGWVPEGWDVLPLDKIAHYQNGLALQKFRPENEDDFLPVVKIAQLKKGWADGEEKASPRIKPECIISDGDVIFSWSGSLVVDIWCGGKAALNQHLFKVTSADYPKWFYHQFTEHHLHVFQRIAADKAVTMGHIKREHLSQAYCASPGSELLDIIGGHFDSLMKRGIANRVENRQLEKVRDLLLPNLLSGLLRIPDAEKLAKVATA